MMLPLFPNETPRKREGLEAKGLCPACKSPYVNLPASEYATCSGPCGKAALVPRFNRAELHALWLSRLPTAEPHRPDAASYRWRWRLKGHDGWWVVSQAGDGIRATRQTETRVYVKWFRQVS